MAELTAYEVSLGEAHIRAQQAPHSTAHSATLPPAQ